VKKFWTYGPEVGLYVRSSIRLLIPLNTPVHCQVKVEIDGPGRRQYGGNT